MLAHIGNIPVEEWLPFVAPLVALYLYGRRMQRRRRAAVAQLPDSSGALDEATVARVLDAWSEKHGDVSREYLPLLYPPGPDGLTATELAQKLHASPETVARQLQELEDRDYVELEQGEAPAAERRAWLTFRGYELVEATESALLAARRGEPAGAPRAA